MTKEGTILRGLLIGALFLFALAALVSCVSTENYSMTPTEAYTCAAKIMGVDVTGPVPPVVYRYGFWEVGPILVRGTYNRRSGVVTVTLDRETNRTLVHEMTHAVQHQLGRPLSQPEADASEKLLYLC